MYDWNEYIKATFDMEPRKNVVNFIEKHKDFCGKAIDIGCGAGNDTIYLINNNWNVIAIDQIDNEKIIREKLDNTMQSKLEFKIQNFENLKLEKCDLVIANYSLSFCKEDHFDEMINNVIKSINKEGFFLGNFFGENYAWKSDLDKGTSLSKEKIIEYFKDFEIIRLNEREFDKKTALGKDKHWHVFDLFAKKIGE